ncbi:hypothetical protein NKJ71_13565 [Mesorhizobium sp. M0050]|uniref:hypothetical protein n=1 Tax=Mesorhizobium sp. M0050 TaxID=2956861 RepID=UPI00333D1AAF
MSTTWTDINGKQSDGSAVFAKRGEKAGASKRADLSASHEAAAPSEGPAPSEARKDAEARVMQEYRWGNLTKLGVANHLRRAGFNLVTAQAKAEALASSAPVAAVAVSEEPVAWLGGENEKLCDATAMRQWEASLKRPDLAEKDRVRGALEAFKRQAIALQMLASTAVAPVAPHSDDAAVDRFAAAMKAKLSKKRLEGRGGWHSPVTCTAQILSDLLRAHVDKGDPVDVGNLAMMLQQRGERII